MTQDQPPNNLIGSKLGRYDVLEEAGRGGMATVYKGLDSEINRTVAIKVLPPHFLQDPSFFERFKREIDVIARLEHPHILPIYDYGKTQYGVPFIVMRYMGGGTISQLSGVDPLQRLERPLRQIAQALDYAHRQGIIHRDIKPGNIMMDEDGNAYLTDFGIAHVQDSQLTGSGIIGTPHYMSPEQIQSEEVTGHADQYSMGVVLYELLAGERPYHTETLPSVLLKHMHEALPPLELYREDIPPAIEEVVAKATSKRPEDRFATVVEMADAFSQSLHGATLATPAVNTGMIQQVQDLGTGTPHFEREMILEIQLADHDDPIHIPGASMQTPLIIGRSDETFRDVHIDLELYGGFKAGVSRRHAAIVQNNKDQILEIWDLGSSNGTYINGERLHQNQRQRIHDGDEIRIAKLLMKFFFLSS